MDTKITFGILSSVLSVLCFLPYLKDIFQKKTQPHMYSWLIWSLLQFIGVAGQWKAGAGWGAAGLFIGAFFCFFIFILSFKYGTKNITRFDIGCFIAAVFALVFYLLISDPLWAVVVVTVTDFVGFLPTFRKGYLEPDSETVSTFVLAAIADIFILAAMSVYSVTTALYPATLFFTNSFFSAIVSYRRWVLKKTTD